MIKKRKAFKSRRAESEKHNNSDIRRRASAFDAGIPGILKAGKNGCMLMEIPRQQDKSQRLLGVLLTPED